MAIRFSSTASVTVANTVSETDLFPLLTLFAGGLGVGSALRVEIWGYYGTDVIPGTLRIRLYWGGAGTAILDTGVQTPTGSLTNQGFHLSALLTVRTIGSPGTIIGQGAFLASTAATVGSVWEMVRTSTQVLDTTGDTTLNVSAKWGTAAAANTLTVTNATVETVSDPG